MKLKYAKKIEYITVRKCDCCGREYATMFFSTCDSCSAKRLKGYNKHGRWQNLNLDNKWSVVLGYDNVALETRNMYKALRFAIKQSKYLPIEMISIYLEDDYFAIGDMYHFDYRYEKLQKMLKKTKIKKNYLHVGQVYL
jgi:hypothetical protein